MVELPWCETERASLEWAMLICCICFPERLAARPQYCNSAPEVDVRPPGGMGRIFHCSQDKQDQPRHLFNSPPITIKERTPLLRNGTGAIVVIMRARAPSDAGSCTHPALSVLGKHKWQLGPASGR